jgi:competence transcription factor ComK
MPKKVSITFEVEETLFLKILKASKNKQLSRSAWIRLLILDHFQQP